MNSNTLIASEGSTNSPRENISGASCKTCTYNDEDDHDTALSSTATSSCIAHNDTDTDNNDVVDTKPLLSTKSIVHKFTHESRFLEILCSRKDTYGDVLYRPLYSNNNTCNNEQDNKNKTETICNSCEYTGKLWFMKLGGIRFREVIQILDITSEEEDCPTSNATRTRDIITLECTSSFNNHRSSSKGEKDDNKFVPCARVTCQLIMEKQKDNEKVVSISIGDIGGELLLLSSSKKLFLLMPGKKQIVSAITSTFRDAMNEYVDELLLLL
uniref:Uncharacterized protein n=1 Tax=Leptocylindrus danicus TaxID=163516 RepID=A0A7S2LMA7_9STRA|mmetsp:Transcript_7525/g.11196  ORF Transcript_7525/g.11196 Transcript_7525/m.11196 type:complete len:270 (+) Transcript_7525:86-895(+)|eukprot:CAMPEP_0116019818 /NCGR_PEP_ID=MMETSP0321-20121206/9452_1 /TAXON_ID=163516 /ORGANISM="Leptocylindrus danicus var. danicus, Strain B650" /LENGTH=269 /DNA_ID=CAMNT_0003490439 /DNA_START=21 /DNA_END=830 /DNA_ORIENTATION=-